MTQNKKKGIAKKALSISLVAAMLATSNVPAWASFEAVSDDAGFTLESEAPVVENEQVDTTDMLTAAAGYDFSKLVLTMNPAWGDSVAPISGSIQDDKGADITAAANLKADFIVGGEKVTSAEKLDASNTTNLKVNLTKDQIGENIKVRLYEIDSVTQAETAEVHTIDLGTVQAKNIADEVTVEAFTAQSYTGKVPTPAATIDVSGASTTGVSALTVDNFAWSYNSDNGANAGATVTVTGTLDAAKAEELGVAGSIKGSFKIQAAATAPTLADVDITLLNKDAGAYTGTAIKLDPSAVSVKLKDTDVTLPVKEVVTADVPTVDTPANVKVILDKDAMVATKNYDGSINTSAGITSTTDETKVSVSARDLSTCTITLISPITAGTIVNNHTFAVSGFKVVGADGKEITLGSEVTLSLANSATASEVYKAKGVYKNVFSFTPNAPVAGAKANFTKIGTADLVVAEKAFDLTAATFTGSKGRDLKADKNNMSGAAAKEYTGSKVEFTKEELGNFKPNGSDTAADMSVFTITYDNNTNASVASSKSYASLTVTGKPGTDYEYNSKTFYFVINPAEVKMNATSEKDNDLTTSIDKNVGGVEVNASYTDASSYAAVIGLKLVARNAETPAKAFNLTSGSDYTVDYKFVKDVNGADIIEGTEANAAGNFVEATVKLKNTNYATTPSATVNYTGSFNNGITAKTDADGVLKVYVPIVEKSIANVTVSLDKDSFVYTGANIKPVVTVKDGSKELKEGEDYTVTITNGIDAGTATVVVTATGANGYRAGTKATKTFTITKANAADLVIEIANKDSIAYTGSKVTPDFEAKLGNVVVAQYSSSTFTSTNFTLKWGDNKDAGKTAGKITLTPTKAGSKNFDGIKEATFEIKGTPLTGTLKILDAKGNDITSTVDTASYPYTGSAVTFANVKFVPSKTGKFTAGKDYEILYVDNVAAGTGYVCVVGKGNYTGANEIEKADGTTLDNVIASVDFTIVGTAITAKDVTVKNGVYAGGLVVKPEVTVVVNGKTLAEGKDFKLVYDANEAINATEKDTIKLTVKGIGAYEGEVTRTADGKILTFGIDKFDLKNASVIGSGSAVTVKNGSMVVPSSEYDVVTNADGSFTVKAKATSKNYTGEKKVEGIKATTLKVTDRTTSAVSLSWDKVEGAEGYTIWFRSEHDSSVSRKIINGGDVTKWTQKGLSAGTKYFYTIKSWVKTDAGYVFSEQSETQRGTTKPMAAKITSATASDGKIKVKLAGKASGADMYSMCYASSRSAFAANNFKVGIRTSYTTRTLDKTFSKGTYYVCVKSYRDLGNGSKVYGAWSNTFKVVVK